MRRSAVVCAVVAACGGDPDGTPVKSDAGVDAGDGRTLVAEIPVTINRDLDLLFVIDDSVGGLEMQTSLKTAFPAFVNVLNALEGGMPNVHIGVVTSDLGTKGASDPVPGPGVGSGPGSCSGNGKAGNLQTNGTALVTGNFISDIKNTDGTRTTNYTGPLSDAFAAIASQGGGGCGFEQPLEAMKRALNNNPANAEFLRPSANLGVIVVTDEDDCSFAHSTLLDPNNAALGPLSSFRCTRFGVTCSDGGTTPDEMNDVGVKSGCHSNEASDYLVPVGSYATFLAGLKAAPSRVYFGTISAPATPFEVALLTPPGGGTPRPALANVCTYEGGGADNSVRVADLANAFDLHTIADVCAPDYTQAVTDMAIALKVLIGDPCLSRTLAMPADCVVEDVVGMTRTAIAACTDPVGAKPCWHLVTDPAACVAFDHLKFQIERRDAPPPETVVSIRCRL